MDEGVGVSPIIGSNSGKEVCQDASVARGVVRRLLQILQLADEPLPQDPVLDPNVIFDLTIRQLEIRKVSKRNFVRLTVISVEMIGIGCDVVLKSPGAAYLHQHRIP